METDKAPWYTFKADCVDHSMLDEVIVCGRPALLEEAARKAKLLLDKVFSEWVVLHFYRLPPQEEFHEIEAWDDEDDEDEAATAEEWVDTDKAKEENCKGEARKRTLKQAEGRAAAEGD